MNWIIASETIEGRKVFAEIWYSKKPTNLGYKKWSNQKKIQDIYQIRGFLCKNCFN